MNIISSTQWESEDNFTSIYGIVGIYFKLAIVFLNNQTNCRSWCIWLSIYSEGIFFLTLIFFKGYFISCDDRLIGIPNQIYNFSECRVVSTRSFAGSNSKANFIAFKKIISARDQYIVVRDNNQVLCRRRIYRSP